jgi:hypothetical protein
MCWLNQLQEQIEQIASRLRLNFSLVTKLPLGNAFPESFQFPRVHRICDRLS